MVLPRNWGTLSKVDKGTELTLHPNTQSWFLFLPCQLHSIPNKKIGVAYQHHISMSLWAILKVKMQAPLSKDTDAYMLGIMMQVYIPMLDCSCARIKNSLFQLFPHIPLHKIIHHTIPVLMAWEGYIVKLDVYS